MYDASNSNSRHTALPINVFDTDIDTDQEEYNNYETDHYFYHLKPKY